LNKTAK